MLLLVEITDIARNLIIQGDIVYGSLEKFRKGNKFEFK